MVKSTTGSQGLPVYITSSLVSNTVAPRSKLFLALVLQLASYVAFHPSGFRFFKGTTGVGITEVEGHAELVFAESMFEKAQESRRLACCYKGIVSCFFLPCRSVQPVTNLFSVSTCVRLSPFTVNLPIPRRTTSLNSSKTLCDPSIRIHRFPLSFWCSSPSRCRYLQHNMMSGKLMTLVESFGYKDDKKVGLESTDEIR